MKRIYFGILAAVFALTVGYGFAPVAQAKTSTAMATKCRDAKGKFIKCKPAMMAPMSKKARCRDAKGKFTKCK